MKIRARPTALLAVAAALACVASTPAAAAPTAPPGFAIAPFASAPPGVTGPDDAAGLDGFVAVAWQNGIGPKGEPAKSGATQSDVILYAPNGSALHDWKVTGHVDGLAIDPARLQIVATVNEDGNTSLFTIAPRQPAAAPVQYAFSPEPDSAHSGGVFTGGGTDGVQVLPDGRLLISASAPNNGSEGPVPNATATFLATLDTHRHVARLQPTFADDASATNALTGETVTLGVPGSSPQALTDPDSNALVPGDSPLYGGQYMLNSQADQQLVFARTQDGRIALTELPLSSEGSPAGVDDVAWTGGRGTLYVVDHSANVIYALTGQFPAGQAYAGLDTLGTAADTTRLDRLDLATGALTAFASGFGTVKGLLFAPARCGGQDAGGSDCGGQQGAKLARAAR
jgi:hypothetical protein